MKTLDQPALFLSAMEVVMDSFVLEGGRFGDHALALLSEIAEFGAQIQASSRRQNPGPPRAQMLPLLTGCASGSRRSLDGFRSPCLTLSFARHLVPPCMGPKLRTLYHPRSLDWLHLLDCPTVPFVPAFVLYYCMNLINTVALYTDLYS